MAETEVAGATATEQAPPAAVPGSEEAPKQERPTGDSPDRMRESARSQVHKMGRELSESRRKAAEARERAQAQPRDDAGKFQEAAPAEEPAEEPPAGASEQQPAGPAEGMVRIEIPEGHELREQGKTHVDVPAGDAELYKGLINSGRRRREVEAATQLVEQERQARIRLESELRFLRERGGEFWTREDQALYDDIIASYTPTLGEQAAKARAEAFKRGREMEARQSLEATHTEAQRAEVGRKWQTEGQAFRRAAHSSLPTQFPGLTSEDIELGISRYMDWLGMQEDQLYEQSDKRMTREQFQLFLAQRLEGYSDRDFMALNEEWFKTRPGVMRAANSQKEAQELERRRIKAETEAAGREQLKDAAKRHATNPERNLGAAAAGPRSSEALADKPDFKNMSSDQIRRSLRESAKDIAAKVRPRR